MDFFPIIDWQQTVQVDSEAALQQAINTARNNDISTKIELQGNILLTQSLTVPERARVYITSGSGGPFTINAGGQGFRVMTILTHESPGFITAVYFGNVIVKGGISTTDGGAVYSTGLGSAVVVLEQGAVFENNTAVNGGAIGLTRGAVGVFGGQLHQNHATRNGGAVFIREGHTQPVYGAFYMATDYSMIIQNEADQDGGGVYVNSLHEVKITGGTIDSNIAGGAGGGLFTYLLSMDGGNITDNRAVAGGGIYTANHADVIIDIAGYAHILNNHAAGDEGGGGIYVREYHLQKLTVGPGVQFNGNTATRGFAARRPEHDAIYLANIHATAWSNAFIQGYNNFDIRYEGAPVPPIPGCSAEGEQMVDICLPVTITPHADVGQIASVCCGPAIITRGDNICMGVPNGNCNFTIRQRMCVRVPVDFSTNVNTGDPHILCTDEGCDNCEQLQMGGEI